MGGSGVRTERDGGEERGVALERGAEARSLAHAEPRRSGSVAAHRRRREGSRRFEFRAAKLVKSPVLNSVF